MSFIMANGNERRTLTTFMRNSIGLNDHIVSVYNSQITRFNYCLLRNSFFLIKIRLFFVWQIYFNYICRGDYSNRVNQETMKSHCSHVLRSLCLFFFHFYSKLKSMRWENHFVCPAHIYVRSISLLDRHTSVVFFISNFEVIFNFKLKINRSHSINCIQNSIDVVRRPGHECIESDSCWSGAPFIMFNVSYQSNALHACIFYLIISIKCWHHLSKR